MRYDELMKIAEKEWTTEGPNSEGIGGYFLYEGKLYQYRGDWGMPEPFISQPLSIADFLIRTRESTDARIQEIVRYVREGRDKR